MIKEHDRVVLTAPLPSVGFEAGDVGTVVHLCRRYAILKCMARMDYKPLKVATLLLGVLLVAGAGCQPAGSKTISLEEKSLNRQNPTTYEFNANVDQVKLAIKKAHEIWVDSTHAPGYRKHEDPPFGASLIWREDDEGALCRGVFDKPENKNDAFLFGGPDAFGRSQVYFKKGVPLLYFADFQIHLAKVDSSKTRVSIVTYEPWVSAGLDHSSPHGPSYIEVDVKPTTVEEYEFLLKIGHELGVQDMPQLVVPGTNSPSQEIKRPRKQ
jgi:hypothetical protein